VIPNLIHPIPVQIQRVKPSLTVFDPVAREPVRQLWKEGQGPGLGSVTELEAQVNWNDGKIGKPDNRPGGPELKSDGYLLFRVFDLVNAGVATEEADGTLPLAISRGDRLVRIGRRVTELYVVFFRDVAGYTDQAGCTMLEVDFADREP